MQTCASLECSPCIDVNNEYNQQQTVCFNAANIDSHHDIIIGRETIKDNNLCQTFPSQFMHAKTPSQHYDGTYLHRSAAGGMSCKLPPNILHGVEKEGGEPGREDKETCKTMQIEQMQECVQNKSMHKNVASKKTETFASLREHLNAVNDRSMHQVIIKKCNLKQIYDRCAWVGSFGKGVCLTRQKHIKEVQNPFKRVSEQLHTIQTQRIDTQEFYWGKMLQMEDIPFEGVFHLSDADLAQLSGIGNFATSS